MLLNKLRQFMAGRYGTDQLNICLLLVYLLVSLVMIPFQKYLIGNILSLVLRYGLLILIGYRMLSKDTAKRYRENQKFLVVWNRVKKIWDRELRIWKERKHFHIYKCEKCGQRIRIPRGKGRICITCPRCKYEFVRKS